jgi:hypothetical protein
MEKHTLVLPINPNIVTLFMSWLILAKEKVRDALGVGDAPSLKFVPAGPLRKEDWPGEAKVEAATLEERGFLFLDCGGGRFDRQALPESVGRGGTSSLHLLAKEAGLEAVAPHLLPVVAIITAQDVKGERITVDGHHRGSSTPHTARHLKNMILGWNLLYGPDMVMQLSHLAFTGIERLLFEESEELQDLPATKAVSRVRDLFLFDRLIEGVRTHLIGAFGNEEDAEVEAERFRSAADQALQCWENEWEEAVRDYWQNAKLRTIVIAERKDGQVVHRKGTLVVGTSDSERFGAVARLGNEGAPYKRPFQGKPFRYKADVVLQFHRNGRFHISTRGEITLDEVSRLIREADLRKKEVEITASVRAGLAQPGNLTAVNRRGRTVETLYFPEYRKGLGNAFRSNPHSSLCQVSAKEIEDLTCKGLGL